MNTVTVYIDGGPLEDGIRGQGLSMDLDWRGWLSEVAGGRPLGGLYYFTPRLPESPYPVKHQHQKAQTDVLSACGFKVVLSATQIVNSIFVERGTEAEFATRLLADACSGTVETALVVSRRAALAPVLDAVRQTGKRVEVAFFHYRLDPCNPLHAHCDSHQVISCEMLASYTRGGPLPFFR